MPDGSLVEFRSNEGTMTKPSIADTFRRHALECERMAKAAPSTASRLEWKQLAERARRCADLYDVPRPIATKGRNGAALSAATRP